MEEKKEEKPIINYYKENKAMYKEKYGRSIYCASCDTHITYWNLNKHMKTKKHVKLTERFMKICEECDTKIEENKNLVEQNKNLIDNLILENIELRKNLKHIEI
jgi:hypothetical protein